MRNFLDNVIGLEGPYPQVIQVLGLSDLLLQYGRIVQKPEFLLQVISEEPEIVYGWRQLTSHLT